MTRKTIISALLILVLAIIGGAGYRIFSRQLLVISPGTVVEVERMYFVGDMVFYSSGGQLHNVEGYRVLAVISRMPSSPEELMLRVEYFAQRMKSGSASLLGQAPDGGGGGIFLLGGLGILVLAFAAGTWALLRRKADTPPESGKADVADAESDLAPRLAGMEDLQDYFLMLYRRQLGAPEDAQGKVHLIQGEERGSGQVFKLSVMQGGEWKTRRITIGKIGEESGAKSQCFYVIFDTHIVVKVPPVPIEDFSEYIRRIRKEAIIAKRLAPRESITPNVTVIMSKIHQLPEAQQHLAPTYVEDNYTRFLEVSPEYQKYLKIANAYAFFMDLSRFYFLGHVLASLHDHSAEVRQTIMSDAELNPDCHTFEVRYGSENGWICFDLQRLFGEFDEAIDTMCHQLGLNTVISLNQRRDAFFSRLAWESDQKLFVESTDSFDKEAKRILDELIRRHPKPIGAYRSLTAQFVKQQAFVRNRSKISAIVANLLDLLEWLGKKQVAIRDLKADNLLVAGDLKNYPNFLTSSEDFTIGLIDVETAAMCRPDGKGNYVQPQLGGTPWYATPSHFFGNAVLESVYADLGLVLHLQDWHAMVGIVFEVVTGQRLFTSTARLIPTMIQSINNVVAKGGSLQSLFQQFNQRFWQQAEKELTGKIQKNRKKLNAVSVFVPERIRARLSHYISQESQALDLEIQQCVEKQQLIRSDKKLEELLKCSHDSFNRTQEKYRRMDSQGARQLTEWLKKLEPLKMKKMRLESASQATAIASAPLTMHAVLELLFGVVQRAMFTAESVAPKEALEEIVDPADSAETVKGFLGYTVTTNL
jgi:serine/threonine protein kinase